VHATPWTVQEHHQEEVADGSAVLMDRLGRVEDLLAQAQSLQKGLGTRTALPRAAGAVIHPRLESVRLAMQCDARSTNVYVFWLPDWGKSPNK
jgi:hypothetical protein